MTALSKLERLERIVAEGLKTFVAVGQALMTIRDEHLYREAGYATFDAYCAERFPDLSRSRRYQYMAAAANAALLGIEDAPESHLRELSKLPDVYKPLAWQLAHQAADDHAVPVTAAVVRRAVSVVEETMVTKSVTIAGEQMSVEDVLRNQVSEEVAEARRRQRQHIADKSHLRLVAKTRARVDGARITLVDAPELDASEYVVMFYVEDHQ